MSTEILRTPSAANITGTGGREVRQHQVSIEVESPTSVLGVLSGLARRQEDLAGGRRVITYGLQRFLRDAMAGKMSCVPVLFCPPSMALESTSLGVSLRAVAPALRSRKMIDGMMHSAHQSSIAIMSPRNGWEQECGWATGAAASTISTYRQVMQLLTVGTPTYPKMVDSEIEDIKSARMNYDDVTTLRRELRGQVQAMLTKTHAVPKLADTRTINAWMVRAQRETWGW